MIKAFIFDLDDTLFDCIGTNEKAVEAVCEYAAKDLIRIEMKKVRKAFDQARLEIKENMIGDTAAQHNRMLYFQRTLEILEIPAINYALEMYDYFWNYVLENIQPFEGVLEFLSTLKEDNKKIAICTDMTIHIQHRKLRALGIAQWVDYIVASEEIGIEKPDQRMYEAVLNKLQVKPEEAIYIGDSMKKDIEGPNAIGILPIWYHEKSQKIPFLQVDTYQELKTLYESKWKK